MHPTLSSSRGEARARSRPRLARLPALLLLLCLGLGIGAPPLLAQESPGDTPAPNAETGASATPAWLAKLRYGGWVTGLQLTLSVVAGGYFFGCLALQRRGNFHSPGFLDKAKSLWAEGRHKELETLAEADHSTAGRATLFLVRHRGNPPSELRAVVSDIASRDVGQLTQRAYPLAVIGTLEPLLGLLGTVLGMIEVFDVVAVAGELGDPGMMADGISKALVTTAVGLILAIPMISAYHYFKNRAAARASELESELTELMTLWFLPREGAPADTADRSRTP